MSYIAHTTYFKPHTTTKFERSIRLCTSISIIILSA